MNRYGIRPYSRRTGIVCWKVRLGAPGMIVVDFGMDQNGAVNQPLPKPFIAVITDAGHNRLPSVPVTFAVQKGGGSFNGAPTTTITTDSDGRAAATLTFGFQEGNSNNLVTATFPGNSGLPASFTASGLGPGDPVKTEISGVVLDNMDQPIPGVSVRALLTNVANSNPTSAQTAAAVQTDAKGRFTIYNAPVGYMKLLVDGSTATVGGTFPSLEYDLVTVPGQINTLDKPVFLLRLKTDNQLCVTNTTGGGTLTIPEAPGFSLTFGPGQVTFPGGSKSGCVSVTLVHPDKVPMVPRLRPAAPFHCDHSACRVISALNSSRTCPTTLLNWARLANGQPLLLFTSPPPPVDTNADRLYANAFLIHESSDPDWGGVIDSDGIESQPHSLQEFRA